MQGWHPQCLVAVGLGSCLSAELWSRLHLQVETGPAQQPPIRVHVSTQAVGSDSAEDTGWGWPMFLVTGGSDTQ